MAVSNRKFIVWGTGILLVAITAAILVYSDWGRATRVRAALAVAERRAEAGDCRDALRQYSRAVVLDGRINLINLAVVAKRINDCFIAKNQVSPESATLFERERLNPLYVAGYLAYRERDCASLKAIADQMVASDPRDLASSRLIASSFLCNKDWANARAWYTRALEANPNDVSSLNGLAGAIASWWLDKRTRPDDMSTFKDEIRYARELYQRAIAIDPSDWAAYYNLALSYFSVRDPDDAPVFRQAYQNVLTAAESFFAHYRESWRWKLLTRDEQNRRLFTMHYLAGQAYAGLGRVAEAKAHFQAMLDIAMAESESEFVRQYAEYADALFVRQTISERIARAKEYLAQHP